MKMNKVVCSSDSDTDFFIIVARVMQRDTLAPYRLIIFIDYIIWTFKDLIKENGFTLIKIISREYPPETMTDADSAP